MPHQETAFIPMCVGTTKKTKPWFAIACLNWTAQGARQGMTGDIRASHEDWRKLKRLGWRIVKVSVKQIS